MKTEYGLLSIVILATVAGVAVAEDEWTWPERAENLTQLPADFPGSRLRAVMTGFTRRLGVSCVHCHVGEDGAPLSTYDFASDANPKKATARKMLQLLGDVNVRLSEIEPSGDQRVNMWCGTCHRGRPRPMTLAEELGEAYRADGVDAAVHTYRDLRKRFYGRGAYDFGEDGLNQLGYQLLEAEDTAGAIKVFGLNAEHFPESGNAWDSLAEAHMGADNRELAIVYYQKALERDPSNTHAAAQLTKLRSGQGSD